MHVVFVVDHLGSGGAQRQAVEIACFLARARGVQVDLLVYHDVDFFGARLREAGVAVQLVRKRGKLDPGLVLGIRRWLAAKRPDLVHAFLLGPALWSLLATLSLPRARRPRFVSAERSALIAHRPRARWLQGFVYRRSDAVTANAAPVAAEIVAKLGVPASRVHCLPNGIDLAAWDRARGAVCPLALEPGCFHLALVGGLRAAKNHALLLDALAGIEPARRERFRVWLVGDETEGRAYADGVRAGIAARGLGAIVRIVPAVREVAALISRMQGVVLPSRFEGFPNAVLEAMASGVPVVATSVGAVPEMLVNGQTGFVVAPGDARAFAAALLVLEALGPTARDALGRRARAVVEARYGIERVADQHLALYRALLRGDAP